MVLRNILIIVCTNELFCTDSSTYTTFRNQQKCRSKVGSNGPYNFKTRVHNRPKPRLICSISYKGELRAPIINISFTKVCIRYNCASEIIQVNISQLILRIIHNRKQVIKDILIDSSLFRLNTSFLVYYFLD